MWECIPRPSTQNAVQTYSTETIDKADWVYRCTARLMERDSDCPLFPPEWDELSCELFETMGYMEPEAAADAG